MNDINCFKKSYFNKKQNISYIKKEKREGHNITNTKKTE